MTLSRNNELGLYMPRSLRGAGLRPWGSLPRLVATLSSMLVRRLEVPKTRLGAGRGLLLWISLSVALLSDSGLKLKLNFYHARGGAFSCSSRFLPSGSHLVWDSRPSPFPRKLLASRIVQSTRSSSTRNTAPGAHLLRGPLEQGDKLCRILRNPSPHDPALS